MWKDYFYNIQRKYSMRLSTKETLIIRLDGKNITKNKTIDLMDEKEKSFMYAMEQSAKYFSEKYKCYAIYGSDEISFIMKQPNLLFEDLSKESDTHSNEVISLFSQMFFYYFNNFDKNKLVFFHAKCFSIPTEKILSYMKYRSRSIENVMVTYFLKKNACHMPEENLEEKIARCKKIKEYQKLERYQKGKLVYNGKKLKLKEFLEGKEIPEENLENRFSDLF